VKAGGGLRLLVLRAAFAAVVLGAASLASPLVVLLAQANAEPDVTCTASCGKGDCTCYASSCVCSCSWLGLPKCKPL
jgi:hypothetical protein